MKTELWKEFIANTIEECGEAVKDETLDAIVECIEVTIENMWMRCGTVSRDMIPSADVEQKIMMLKQEINELSSEVEIFRKSVAIRRGVSVSDVYIDGQTVMYRI